MSDNPVLEWYSSDQKLKEIIDALSFSNKSHFEQAKEAFYKISDLYNLPKYPSDITEAVYKRYEQLGVVNPRSVFEEVGIIRYLEPNDDPRGVVLFALNNVKNGTYLEMGFCAEKHFGSHEKTPKSYMIYYTGEDADSRLNFLNEGESWTKEGVRFASKIIQLRG